MNAARRWSRSPAASRSSTRRCRRSSRASSRAKKFVYLCTNAILLAKHIDEYKPSPYLTFSMHLDGNRERHDESVCQEGVFDKAVAAIRLARPRASASRSTARCSRRECRTKSPSSSTRRMALGIEGITVSPGYSYQHAPRQDVFLGRSASKQLFREDLQATAAARGSALAVQPLIALPRFPRRQPDLPVHALEHSDLQRVRLAAALLPADR